jgi:hypothetical protein
MNFIEQRRALSRGELAPEPIEADASRTTMVDTSVLTEKIQQEDDKPPQAA